MLPTKDFQGINCSEVIAKVAEINIMGIKAISYLRTKKINPEIRLTNKKGA